MKKHLFFVVILAVIFAVVLINHNEKIENSVVTGATPVTEWIKTDFFSKFRVVKMNNGEIYLDIIKSSLFGWEKRNLEKFPKSLPGYKFYFEKKRPPSPLEDSDVSSRASFFNI
ncbi:hypothetical protein L6261_04060 [Candidatus Parcubacteria bacterium]|nr:hypothetical protein [Candidatus Parcubacteria bacterium]